MQHGAHEALVESHFSRKRRARNGATVGWVVLSEIKFRSGGQECPPHTDGQSSPSSFHFLSTSALVFSSIRISSGQGRVKPSLGHLRVASLAIFDPELGRREGGSGG